MGDFTNLEVWKLSHNLVIEIYRITCSGTLAKDFGLRDQMRRAAISIPSNIAEGEESGFNKLGVRYFYNAKASLAELRAQIMIAYDVNHLLDVKIYKVILQKIDVISMKLRKLIEYRTKHFDARN
ncbi:MAG: four helix bundle protein [Bacteroidetes bacterium]|nr:MAG: four helix bundle protein [Bacteroidota bacterium]RLD80199.1 MAG: four helix bundle protein [Bacteroidota bacterium]